MMVWGGSSNPYLTSGGRYNPSTNMWAPMSSAGAPVANLGTVTVWTGQVMIAWSGIRTSSGTPIPGGLYNPATDTWTTMTTTGSPSARLRVAAVWTGTRMVVWGGQPGDSTGGMLRSDQQRLDGDFDRRRSHGPPLPDRRVDGNRDDRLGR